MPVAIVDEKLTVTWCNAIARVTFPQLLESNGFVQMLLSSEIEKIMSELSNGKSYNYIAHNFSILSKMNITPVFEKEKHLGAIVHFVLDGKFGSSSQPDAYNRVISMFTNSFREPLSSVFTSLTYATSMSCMPSDPDFKFCMSKISRDCYKMLRASSNIAEHMRYASGNNTLKLERIDFAAAMGNLLKAFGFYIGSTKIHFQYHVANLNVPMLCDFDKISKAMFNLISNSCIFCEEESEVSVSVKFTAKNAIVSVSDTGFGIPVDMQQRVFDPFVSFDFDGKRSAGIGLGLSLVKNTIYQHNGTITLNSTVGLGTTIAFSIPIIDDMDLPLSFCSDSTKYLSDRFSDMYVQLSTINDCTLP